MARELSTEDRRPASLLGSAVVTYATNVAVALFQLGNALVTARGLGTTGRGDVALLMAIPLIVSQIATLSLHEATANVGGAEPERRGALATNALVFSALLGGLAALVVFALVHVAPGVAGNVDHRLLWAALMAIPCLVLKVSLQFLLQSDYRFAVTNVAWVLGPLIAIVANGAMALAGRLTVTSAILTWVAGQVISTGMLAVATHSAFGFAPFDGRLGRRCLRFGLTTHVGRLMDAGSYRMDQWFVGSMAGTHELGLYSVAVSWAEVLFYVPGIIILVQRPDLVRALPAGAAELGARVFRRSLLLAAVVGTGLFVAAPLLCVTAFGEQFSGAVPMLRLLAVGAFGIVAIELLTNVLVAQSKLLIASAALGAAFALTLALDLLLIPGHGGRGAAIATSAAYSAGGMAAIVLFARVLPGSAWDLLPRPSDLAWYRRKVHELASLARAERGRYALARR